MRGNYVCIDQGCERPGPYRQGMCDAHRKRVEKTGSPQWDKPLRRKPRPKGEFDAQRDVLDHLVLRGTCLTWPYATDPAGRGKVRTPDGKYRQVHRVVYEHVYGEIPDGLLVLHRCGKGHLACADPGHLYAGDIWDNVADAKRHRLERLGESSENPHRQTGGGSTGD